ncbi:amidohydrolase family protein [Rhizobium sp. P32RR-XVIII]|uniref:amidohydrolase family protein n=1 Tax=Rhizobium sp. P32RR-XVIII TaxID=2726738 RepID=UPI001456C85D|nr:amidohydrolase family protein [Rhizobium sp. P32RR-XVIII]NLS06074.1 amidohydrolase family protein [Rhizobium sp. P32RR-XVIII]
MTTENQIVPPTIPGPDPNPRKPHVSIPALACDCHAHVFGPQTRYKYSPSRRYTPADALLPDYVHMLRVLGFGRGVLVQPSAYMTDNTALLDALAESEFPLRGIAVVEPTISDSELERMNTLGVRGLRLNLKNANGMDEAGALRIAQRIKDLGWHIVLRIDSDDLDATERLIDKLPVDVAIDHFGQIPVKEGLNGTLFTALLRLLRGGRLWMKMTGPMRISKQEFPHADVVPFAQALAETAPDRLLWGTDWPHTTIETAMPNDGDLCDLLSTWIPDADTRKKILVDNPARLFGFEAG